MEDVLHEVHGRKRRATGITRTIVYATASADAPAKSSIVGLTDRPIKQQPNIIIKHIKTGILTSFQ